MPGWRADRIYLSSLFTNDSQAAETYADMMQKRNEIRPNAKTPPTLGELFALASDYLRRAGKQDEALSATLLIEDAAKSPSPSVCRSYITASGSRMGLRAIVKSKSAPAVGDLWITLSPADGEHSLRYRTALERIWSTRDLTKDLKDIRVLGRGGVLSELLECGEGASIDLSALTEDASKIVDSLTADRTGEYLLRVSVDRFFRVSRLLARVGIRASAIAVVQRDRMMNLLFSNNERVTWELDFLTDLLPREIYEARLPNEDDSEDAPIVSRPHTLESSRYLASDVRLSNDWVCLQSGICSSVAVCRPDSRFFENALRTALAPVMTLTAAGCDYTRQSLAIGLTLPNPNGNAERLGECVSAILGLYRLQAELALTMVTSKLVFSDDIQHPELTVFALTADHAAESLGFSRKSHPIYCLSPKQGTPVDFADLRRLLSMVATLRQSGYLPAARPMMGEKLSAAIAAMETDTVTAKIDPQIACADDMPRAAFLLEATDEIEAIALGQTLTKAPATAQAPQALSKKICLIPSIQPEVVLLADRESPDLRLLTDLLEERGANVAVFTAADLRPMTHLCRAILGAQTLIVMPEAEIPSNPHLGFALRTLARANGRILFPARQTTPDISGAVALPDGLTTAMLSQICKK